MVYSRDPFLELYVCYHLRFIVCINGNDLLLLILNFWGHTDRTLLQKI